VDLDLPAGRVVGLLGASGAGKSTLLRALAGVIDPAGGSVRLEGRTLRPEPGAGFPSIGYLMQRPERQFFAPTIAEEVGFALARRGAAVSADGDLRVRRALAAVGAAGLLDGAARAPWATSRGQQRLVALASVTVFAPRVLLLDEPSAGLDVDAARTVWGAIRAAAAGGAAVLVAGHDVAALAASAHRLELLAGGRLERVRLTDASGREALAREGLPLPDLWSHAARWLGDFWPAERWREPVETLAERVAEVLARRWGGGR